jgi:glucose/arabinose dehydrogenase
VGQNKYEEVDFQLASSPGGENYGWNIMEGMHCYRSGACDKSGLTMPVAEYDHAKGCSITGGMVYRGNEFPGLQGIYFSSDYCSGRIWGLRRGNNQWQVRELLGTGHAVSTFGEDEEGNVYVADHRTGGLYRIEVSGRMPEAPKKGGRR